MKGPEATFQKDVIELAHTLGWRVAHFRTALNKRGHYQTPVAADGKGFPDLCMARRGRVVFAELKSEDGVVSEEQKVWIAELETHVADRPSHEAYIWRPRDLEFIMRVLR